VVLGVSFDPEADNAAFAQKFTFPFELLCDTRRELGVLYGAADAPDSAHARRIAYIIGPDGRVRHVWPKVDVKAFADEVLRAL